MNRKEFLKIISMLPLGAIAGVKALDELDKSLQEDGQIMPVLFVGHGSPMNAIEDNVFSRGMTEVAKKLPKPKAILMVSAHWETKGTFVTSQVNPPTIHDFGGFPQALFDVQYPAAGSLWLAEETQKAVTDTSVQLSDKWGLDHGCWSVTKNMFPNADIPIVQLSLDYTKDPSYHYNLGKQLFNLRKKGVLIMGSGNMVHNFQYLRLNSSDFNAPFAHDWALEANDSFKKQILSNDTKSLIGYQNFSKATKLAAPTPEHYLPLLYAVSLRGAKDEISFFNDLTVAGSFSMTSVLMEWKA